MKRIDATLSCHQVIHARPAAILVKVGRRFPDTEIRLVKAGANGVVAELDILSLMMGGFHDGDKVVIETEGTSEVLAGELFRVALENFKDPAQAHLKTEVINYDAVGALMFAAIDEAFPSFTEECLDSVVSIPSTTLDTAVEELRLAYLNDRLHNFTVPVLPAIAAHYGCTIELRFETKSGIHVCVLKPDSDELVVGTILLAAPEAGTRITIVGVGDRRQEACCAMQSVLNNLRQCDEWLRQRKASLQRNDLVNGFLAYALTIAQLPQQAASSPSRAEIGKLLTDESVIVYLPSSTLSKEEVLHQLVAVQSVHYATLVEDDVLESVWRRERLEPVILREGLALPHASIEHGPRIAVSIAVVPKGVEWDASKLPVKVIVLFIYAEDTHRTYLEHVAQLAAIFRGDRMLQEALVCAKNAREVVRLIRQAEESIAS